MLDYQRLPGRRIYTPVEHGILAAGFNANFNRGFNRNFNGTPAAGGGGGPAWSVDGTKGWAVPSTVGQWNALIAAASQAIGAPTHDWELQEASGNAVDYINSVALVPTTSPTQNQAMSGWSRVGVRMTAGLGNKMLQSSFGSSATTTLNGFIWCRYNAAPTAAGQVVMTYGGNNDFSVTSGAVSGVQSYRYRQSGNIQELTNVGTADVVLWVSHDVTNAYARIADLTSIQTIAYGVTAGGTSLSLGAAAGTTTAPVDFLKATFWVGTAGEWGSGAASAAIAKALMTTIVGTAPAWTAA
jgi:hypothetical protein